MNKVETKELIFDDIFIDLKEKINGNTISLKLENHHPTGSIKFKTARSMLDAMEQQFNISGTDAHIVESSSGNLGVALAYLCQRRGYRFTCVVDPNVQSDNARLIQLFGGTLSRVDKPHPTGGFLKARLNRVAEILESTPNTYWTNQYNNPANAEAHRLYTAPAILRNVPDVDIVVVGAGTTGTLLGCLQYFHKEASHVKIIAADSIGSVTFGEPAAPRYLPGVGTGVRPPLADSVDSLGRPEIMYVDELNTIKTCRQLLKEDGVLLGASSGTVAYVLKQVAKVAPAGTRLVGIAPDGGERYANTVYCDQWVESKFNHALS